jgi:hypothetical protein
MIIICSFAFNIYINNPFLTVAIRQPQEKPSLPDNKEVFHISDNIYTYNGAIKACKKYGAKLATREQLEDAYNKGANWCSYGWSANGEAYFPIQKDYYNKLSKNGKIACGKPGLNGGQFDDDSLEFGANCYGIRPSKDEIKSTDTISPFNSNLQPNSKIKVETFVVDSQRIPIYNSEDDDKYHPFGQI